MLLNEYHSPIMLPFYKNLPIVFFVCTLISIPMTFVFLECPPNSTVSSCGTDTLCLQTSPGIYNCSCKIGYTGSGYNCTDINECTTGQHQCSVNADCMNTDGSYACQCKFGYFGNGTTCDGKNIKIPM